MDNRDLSQLFKSCCCHKIQNIYFFLLKIVQFLSFTTGIWNVFCVPLLIKYGFMRSSWENSINLKKKKIFTLSQLFGIRLVHVQNYCSSLFYLFIYFFLCFYVTLLLHNYRSLTKLLKKWTSLGSHYFQAQGTRPPPVEEEDADEEEAEELGHVDTYAEYKPSKCMLINYTSATFISFCNSLSSFRLTLPPPLPPLFSHYRNFSSWHSGGN